jgi:hypothetical protein
LNRLLYEVKSLGPDDRRDNGDDTGEQESLHCRSPKESWDITAVYINWLVANSVTLCD